jgi:hypothetical protein
MHSRGILDPERATFGWPSWNGSGEQHGRSISRPRRTRWASVVTQRLGVVPASACW